MSDDVFRLVVTAAVVLAAISFLVQAVVSIVVLKAFRRVQEGVEDIGTRVATLSGKMEPLMESVGPMITKAAPVIERIGPMMQSLTETMERSKPAIAAAVELMNKAVPVVDQARQVVTHTDEVLTEARPQITKFSEEAVGAARAARAQVDRIGDLLHDASDRAHARLEQIDNSLQQTVGQVGQVGDAMKRAVMRPVREANGVAAGISAAVSSLVHPRKSPDAVTQDEEMFI